MQGNLEQFSINKHSKVLFIYPHPDDETYTNGVLIQRLVSNNIPTRLVCLSKGGASTLKFGVSGGNLKEIRQKEFVSVMNYLKISDYEMMDLEDNNINQTQNLLDIVKNQIDK